MVLFSTVVAMKGGRYFLFILILSEIFLVDSHRHIFDEQLYKDVLDPVQCSRQLNYLSISRLGLQFLDASAKLPSGILTGNLNDLGDYFQCLSINNQVNQMNIQGKYCLVSVPLEQQFIRWPPIDWPSEWPIEFPPIDWPIEWPPSEWPPADWPVIDWPPPVDNDTLPTMDLYTGLKYYVHQMTGLGLPIQSRIFPLMITAQGAMALAMCIPKVCTVDETVTFLQRRLPVLNITYGTEYCRLPNDKPFAAADYTAFIIFSIIGLLLIVSTSYDLYQHFVLKLDPKKSNPLYTSFSIYTNTRRFLVFKSTPESLECVDGIRALSMLWVVVGHTYCMSLLGFVHNLNYTVNSLAFVSSIWIVSAPIVVDSFFLLSGVLAVYAVIGKISKARFIRTVHLFYLNRILRIFPLLATVILLQTSVFMHLSDGPYWENVAHATENCRDNWWSALLHIQNYVNSLTICLSQSWYLSVDMQLYIVCPLVLIFLFGRDKLAWGALTVFTLLCLLGSSLYSFLNNYSAALGNPNRLDEFNDYIQYYYMNTLSRAPPFAVGMIYGYILYQCKDRKIYISKINVILLWLLSFAMMAFCLFTMNPVMQADHDGQMFDNFLNAYMRAIWGIALGWLIFACHKGYGGPINWFLSLDMWKLPARMSYAMYLIHVPIIMIANGSWVKTYYYSDGNNIYRFMSDVSLAFIAAFILCIAIDAPCSTLQKLLMTGGARKPRTPAAETPSPTNIVVEDNSKSKL